MSTRHLRAVALRPRVGKYRNTLGEALRRGGHFAAAIAQLRTAVQLEPRSPGANGNLASALQAMGRQHEAHRFREVPGGAVMQC